MNEVSNNAKVLGNYNNLPTELTSDEVTVPLVTGLTIEKTADKQSWAEGPLTYTITINNNATESYETPVITDVIDTTLVTFVTDSVYINGTKATSTEYNYNAETHTLTVNLTTIPSISSSTVTFQVSKKS